MKRVRRVHIIGGPGSGKTTLARRLGSGLGAPTYDLDEVGYEGGAGRTRSLAERVADVRRIAGQPAWVTEGIYLWWTDDLLRTADAIVWLDVPWRVAAWRIVVRHIRASLAGTNRHPGLRKLVRFVLRTRRYYGGARPAAPVAPDDDGATTRAATAERLAPYAGKLVHWRHSADEQVLLRRIC